MLTPGGDYVNGEWTLVLLVVALIVIGVVYVVRPELFSRGWFSESQVELPSPARNRVIGFVFIGCGVVAGAAWTWAAWMMRR